MEGLRKGLIKGGGQQFSASCFKHRIGTTTEVSLRYIMWYHFCIAHVVLYASDLLARKMVAEIVTRL